jgi:putative alpha-1,2-mannosidase
MKVRWLLAGAVISLSVVGAILLRVEKAAEPSFGAHVDPLIGVDGSGNTVPGAVVPFGFVQLSPDTTKPRTSVQLCRRGVRGNMLAKPPRRGTSSPRKFQ